MQPNRLAKEKSPYLLQHAQNPVDWFPWGNEAFEKAKKENKPIFLSVGYSTCHWCHVMEKESFESAEIAEILNKHFVSIKVDREERPDIDRMHMTFVQALTGAGGWPMSVWLTPGLKPFYGGTYFPPESRWGRPGFRDVLLSIADKWEKEQDQVEKSGTQMIDALKQHAEQREKILVKRDETLLQKAFQQFHSSYDRRYGGFGTAPKFPRPSVFHFLLRYHLRMGSREALDMSLHTLREMAKGGMYDQLGGGFHRYSTDERWHVPHFEKMLYDQAQLVMAYLEAYQISKEDGFSSVARDILEYVLREMTSPEGAFYSAEDADSVADPANPKEKKEGAFFIWSKSEIEQCLGKDAAALLCFRYGVAEQGNAHNDPHGEFKGKNILFQAQTLESTAAVHKMTLDEAKLSISASRQKLFQERSKRTRPHLDDKVLTSWNGLMISAFSKAGAILNEERYSQAARKAAEFILSKMRDPKSGVLLRRYRLGSAEIHAFGDDYAFLIQGLLDLYENDFRVEWLRKAMELSEEQKQRLWDEKEGAFFDSPADDPSILIRMKESYDGAEPAPNSISALNLLRLAQITDNATWQSMAAKILSYSASAMDRMGHSVPQMLVALDFSLSKPKQIVICGNIVSPDTQSLLRMTRSPFLPNKVLILVGEEDSRKSLAALCPFVEPMKQIDGKATVYVCENYTCKAPTNDANQLAELLK